MSPGAFYHPKIGPEGQTDFIRRAEKAFRRTLKQPLQEAEQIGEADITVGIPFYDEADTIGHVVETAKEGLETFYPDKKCLICCVGTPAGGKVLEMVQSIPLPEKLSRIAFLMRSPMTSGRGWALRAAMEIAERLGSDLVILEADLLSKAGENGVESLSLEWLSLLLEPIRKEGVDLVLPRFNRHFFDFNALVSNHLIRPLIASIYNLLVQDPLGGELAISSKLLKIYLEELKGLAIDVEHYGADVWLLTEAITKEANISEASLGIKLQKPSPGKQNIDLREQAKIIFRQISLSRDYWKRRGEAVCALKSFAPKKAHRPVEVKFDLSTHIARYRQGFNKFHSLYQEILAESTLRELKRLAEGKTTEFVFSSKLWSEIVYDFLLAFSFDGGFARGDILNAFVPLYQGRVAGFAKPLSELEKELKDLAPDKRERLLTLWAEEELEEQVEEFIREKPAFLARWRGSEEEAKPPLPRVTYREFIPGVPLVLPQEITSPMGETVNTDNIYKAILGRYQREFEEFVYERLKMPPWATSFEIAEAIRALIGRAERELDRLLLQGDLYSTEGIKQVAQAIFRSFPHQDTFALKPEVTSWLLRQFPPTSLLIKFGKATIADLEKEYEPNDILALSSFSEEREYMQRIWEWIEENARPEHFGYLALKPLVVSCEDFPSLVEIEEASALSKLSGRVVISNCSGGMGGEFPKLRYFTTIAKNIVEAERFGEVWAEFARKKKEFGRKVINSLEGHWGREPLSAHNIFENKHQRILVTRLKEMLKDFQNRKKFLSLAKILVDMADSYHLASTLPDGKFIPCSAWTWASYSFKGGKGFPTPLSLHVERDWASREFLVELYQALGGTEKIVDEKIVELMGQGRESENLAKVLFPQIKEAEEVSPQQIISLKEPQAQGLKRFRDNPLLKPIKKHPWESRYVFNAGAIRLGGRIYIIYRAMGEDMVSRLGLAVTSDGFQLEGRVETPIFEPEEEWEEKGCEDPRLTLTSGRVYMLYTAYSSIAAQIALASIDVEDFLTNRWNRWERHGLLFPGFSDKDAILFPEKFNGRYALYHRIEPSIWVSFSENLDSPWSRKDHRILIGPRAGMIWDGVRIGAGTQPVKTKYGWLLIYHGVDFAHIYRLGVLVVDLNDPARVLYRSPNFVLEPKERYEVGEEGISQVTNVVFTCGAVPVVDKEVLDDEDQLLIYYGAADTTVAVAMAKVSELVPEKVQVGNNL